MTFLPLSASDAASAGRPKGKASRVLGRDGRTLHNIIEDAIIRIRALKSMQGKSDASTALAAYASANDFEHRQALLSSKSSLWALELELPDFKVVAMSEGLQEWSSTQLGSSGEDRTLGAQVRHASRAPLLRSISSLHLSYVSPTHYTYKTASRLIFLILTLLILIYHSYSYAQGAISYLCERIHPDDEFALRKAVADHKMAGTRIPLRFEQRAVAAHHQVLSLLAFHNKIENSARVQILTPQELRGSMRRRCRRMQRMCEGE